MRRFGLSPRGAFGIVIGAALLAPSSAFAAEDVQIKIENLMPAGGFSFTPFWLGVQNGSFTTFDPAQSSSLFPGITDIAELGSTAAISTRFSSGQPGGTQTTFADPTGAPVFSPGESSMTMLSVANPQTNRFFSFASMVVPSNDLFVGNANPIQLFDATGHFLGPITIEIRGSIVWDNGSEVNNIANGPAFVVGQDATLGADEFLTPHFLFGDIGGGAYIASIVGTNTPIGQISQTFASGDVIGRITIVPEPASLGLGMASVVLLFSRRRRAAVN